MIEKTIITLAKMQTPEQLADWVYGYRKAGFFQKINFKQWNTRLYTLGISAAFWKRYRQLKGDEPADGFNPDNYFLSSEQKQDNEEKG